MGLLYLYIYIYIYNIYVIKERNKERKGIDVKGMNIQR
jgi:hypothetical protein